MSRQDQFSKKIEARIEEYTRRYFAPSPATIGKWKKQIARELDNKNQLRLPLDYGPTWNEQTLFSLEEAKHE